MGMVPVCTVVGSRPSVYKSRTGRYWFLGDSRNSIRPWSADLINAMKVDRSIEGHKICDGDFNFITLSNLDRGAGKLSVGENHLPCEAIWRMRLPREAELITYRRSVQWWPETATSSSGEDECPQEELNKP